mmetsp:Transcript_23460/g.55588  ORF Transcript_23460/g.55588 Transcript_23460/m.55588 type:complete len:207 (-) Transcript_23460:490-1110(-)
MTPTSAGRRTRPFNMYPFLITCPTVPGSPDGSGYSINAFIVSGSKTSPGCSQKAVTPFDCNAFVSPVDVNWTPSKKLSTLCVAVNVVSSSLVAVAASKARSKLSATSNNDLAKLLIENCFAASTSRRAMLRIFSCSANDRNIWSLMLFTSSSNAWSFFSAVSSSPPSVPPSPSAAVAASSASVSVVLGSPSSASPDDGGFSLNQRK